MALIPLPHKPFPEAAQSFDSHLLHPLLRQQSAIAIKRSSGRGGYCPQPFKGCPLPIPLTVASAGLHDLAPALWPALVPTMLLLILSLAPRAAGTLPSAQDGALAFPYLSAVGPDISSLELLREAFFVATVSPEPGKASENGALSQDCRERSSPSTCPSEGPSAPGASNPGLLSFAPQRAQTSTVTGPQRFPV